MQLAEWMAERNVDDADMARRITDAGVKCDRTQVNKYRRRKIRPDWPAIGAIRAVTGGLVTADDFLMLAEAAE